MIDLSNSIGHQVLVLLDLWVMVATLQHPILLSITADQVIDKQAHLISLSPPPPLAFLVTVEDTKRKVYSVESNSSLPFQVYYNMLVNVNRGAQGDKQTSTFDYAHAVIFFFRKT